MIVTLFAWTLLLGAPAALPGGGPGVDATLAPQQPLQSPAAVPAFLIPRTAHTCLAAEGASQHRLPVSQLALAVSAEQHGDDGHAGFSASHRRRDKTEAAPAPQAQWGRRDRFD